jgi:serine/threonine protein kinase
MVYLARQLDLDRLVALKELRVSTSRPEDFARRFLRESRVAGSLSHPNIVTVYEYFEHDGIPYIVMEYLERGSLRPYVGTLEPVALAGVLEGVLAGLACGEEAGIVHRDLKPENIMVTGDGRVKLTDFGIAKATLKVGAGQFETTVGMTVGTPSYMAPEQALGEPVGPWTDLYSVGIMTWEHLVGHVPFSDTAATPTAVLLRHVNEQIPAPITIRPDVDPALSDWVEGLVANRSADRPQTATEAWDSLEQILVAQLGPLWRREARLKVQDARPSLLLPTPDLADRFGAYPVIAKQSTEAGADQPPEPPGASSADHDAYHTYLGEDPAKRAPAEPPPAAVAPPPPPIVRNIVLRPQAVQVRPGERAEIEATVGGGPMPGAQWELAGGASAFATANPTADGASIEVHPGPGEPPWSSSLEVRCLDRGAVAASATATVDVLEQVTEAVRGPGRAPPTYVTTAKPDALRKRAVAVVAGAWLVFMAALTVDSLHYGTTHSDLQTSLYGLGKGSSPTVTHTPFWILTVLASVVLVLAVVSMWNRAAAWAAMVVSLALIVYSLVLYSGAYNSQYGPGQWGAGFWLSLAAAIAMAVATGVAATRPRDDARET